jgi:hypothetical protein
VQFAALALALSGLAHAQSDQPKGNSVNSPTGTTPPETKGQLQPQGWTGPIDTYSGGAPPRESAGTKPPGMQPAPDGSTKTVVKPRE